MASHRPALRLCFALLVSALALVSFQAPSHVADADAATRASRSADTKRTTAAKRRARACRAARRSGRRCSVRRTSAKRRISKPSAAKPRAASPVAGALAETRPVGTAPLSDAEAAARVRRTPWEPRPRNAEENERVPTAAELAAFHKAQAALDEWNVNPYAQKVTGNFTGTTDEIIQWGAWKWGIDEEIMRAVAITESWWHQHNATQDGKYTSYGLMQVLNKFAGTDPLSRVSTAFNVDFYGASFRFRYDGLNRWYNDVEHGKRYQAGDLWGTVGAWYAGAWWTEGATWYIDFVKKELADRRWLGSDFLGGA